MSEKFSLKWNDFDTNVSKSFGRLRNEDYLHDVTLVGDDYTQIPAHKLVLSACSEYFQEAFKRSNKIQSHTLLCLEGLSKQDLDNVLNYMYNGEVNIYQEDLDKFLSVAQRLKLEGLLEGKQEEEDTTGYQRMPHQEPETSNLQSETGNELNQNKHRKIMSPKVEGSNNTISLNTSHNGEIDAMLDEHLEVLEGGHFRCRLCGKDSFNTKRNARQSMRYHVERHMEGLTYICQHCGKDFRSKNSLNSHKSRTHSLDKITSQGSCF